MARWRVAQGNLQFTAEDLAELQRFARQGKIGPGDLIQPPGAADWLYALEMDELKTHIKQNPGALDMDAPRRSGLQGVLAVVLLAGIAACSYGIYYFVSAIPEPDELELLGEKGLKLTEVLATASAPLRATPDDSAESVGNSPKNGKLALLAKRGGWYRVRDAANNEGWVKVDEVVPAYLFAGAEARQDYDPLYNPDRYVAVKNSSWMQLPDQQKNNVTVFQFMLTNESKFSMDSVKLLATIKDSKDQVLEKKEITIDGLIPPRADTMVGTLAPDPKDKADVPRLMTDVSFLELQKQDPDLALRWSAGIEVQMETKEFEKAVIDVLEVRAIPPDDAPGTKK